MAKVGVNEIGNDLAPVHPIVHVDGVLVEVVLTLSSPSCFPRRLNCREEKPCQERNHCNRHKQFNESKATASHNPPHRSTGAKGAI